MKAACDRCGTTATSPGDARAERGPRRYDLSKLVALAASERAYDETVKVRVTQEDIIRLVAKRRKDAP